ncbi:uncharacterized protein LOC121375664 isoform X2 [Gigantopelta aegis]|uniref:uncharacterized protein LOC121375664 isoform X2 n=1 Tax=Gigantopelta aegis TaxID=1735272 RepID=UPI001B88AA5A|nr:uncharacterized protein LOC121375664 isoform X2 [Gigantopelta aegis]
MSLYQPPVKPKASTNIKKPKLPALPALPEFIKSPCYKEQQIHEDSNDTGIESIFNSREPQVSSLKRLHKGDHTSQPLVGSCKRNGFILI